MVNFFQKICYYRLRKIAGRSPNWNGTVKTLEKRLPKGRSGLLSRVKSCFATFPENANWQRVAEALKGINSLRWGQFPSACGQ